jgi:hypothetical protein
MPATVQINEFNGAGQTETLGIGFCHFLGADLAGNIDRRTANPIDKPISGVNRSFEKFFKVHLVALSGSVSIGTIRHYFDAAPPTGYSGFSTALNPPPAAPTYATPTNADSAKATTAMNLSDPGNAQIGGTLTADGQKSDFVVVQLDVSTSAASGYSSVNQVFKYAEIS